MLGFDALGRLSLGQLASQGSSTAVLLASSGSYSISGNAIGMDSRVSAASGAYAIGGNSVGLNLRLSAASGAYAISGNAAVFPNTLRADAGAYGITGSNAVLNNAFAIAPGNYVITGGTVEFIDLLAAGPGSYAITGNPVTFPQALVTDGGSYVITLGEYELRRTGGDYPQEYGGIGHYLEEAARLKQLNAITRKVPPPVVRAASPKFTQSPPQTHRAPTPDLLQMLQAAATERAAVAEQQALAKRKRQEAEILFLLAS